MSSEKVTRYYDSDPAREKERLSRGFYVSLEKSIVLHLIRRYFPTGGRLLDVGGGPAIYTAELLDMGFDVTLCDISTAAVAYAREHFGDNPRFRAHLLDARELEKLGREAFDCVMVMGPFYHLLQPEERQQALLAARVVLKPGGVLMAAAITFCGYATDLIDKGLYGFFLGDQVPLDPRGDGYPFITPEGHPFVDLYMTRPAPFRAFFEANGFRTITVAGSKGFFSGRRAQLDAAPPEVQRKAEAITLATCEDPDIIGLSEHLFYVGTKG
ncbi:MAG: class I SAM-dependent methyltransferase [Anaerolineae bacterium]